MMFSGSLHAQVKKTLILDGWTNFIEVSDHDSLDYNGTLSIEAWINPNCMDNAIIVSKQWCTGEYAYYLSVRNGRLIWSFSNTGLCIEPNWIQSVDALIPKYEFTHVAVMHTPTDIKMFINGNEVSTVLGDGKFVPIRNSSEPFRIGAYKGITGLYGNFFSGAIDEVRVWNIPLSETKIKASINTSLNGNEPGLVANYSMEQSGVGTSEPLINNSKYGANLNGRVQGATSSSPFLTDTQYFDFGWKKFDDTVTLCKDSIFTIDVKGFQPRVVWFDGSTAQSKTISKPGSYWYFIETERCKLSWDTFVVKEGLSSRSSYSHALCTGDSIIIGGKVYKSAVKFEDTVTAVGGSCHTIEEHEITILDQKKDTIFLTFCPENLPMYLGDTLKFGDYKEYSYLTYQGCDSTIWVNATEETISTQNFLGSDMVICDSNITLNSPSANTTWNTGQTNASILVNKPGLYHASFINSKGCIHSDSIHVDFVQSSKVYVPNTFSPNNDGKNDCFMPSIENNSPITNFRFQVYSRWGEKLVDTKDQNYCWDGQYKNKLAHEGIYFWSVEGVTPCKTPLLEAGTVTLLR